MMDELIKLSTLMMIIVQVGDSYEPGEINDEKKISGQFIINCSLSAEPANLRYIQNWTLDSPQPRKTMTS